jgi:hypothetical protein
MLSIEMLGTISLSSELQALRIKKMDRIVSVLRNFIDKVIYLLFFIE